jgi:Cu2+-exporting ATPase
MEFAVRHFIPGRIRVHAPALCIRRKLAEETLAWLRKLPGVTFARVNYDCHSIVVEYQKDNDAAVRELVGHLGALTIEELRTLVGMQGSADEQLPLAAHSDQTQLLPPRRAPLALPTLSLGLAFSSNPAVFAINLPLMAWNAYPIALRAWRVWRREGRLNIDFLDVLAISASILQGNPMAGAVVT